jgi:isoquinoline 1-oxidoreductase alpha subunit
MRKRRRVDRLTLVSTLNPSTMDQAARASQPTTLSGVQEGHIDGTAQRSCQLDVGSVAGKAVVTIEGLSSTSSHPLQKAWVVEEVPQCGYCQSGQIMKAAELLAKNPKPSRADIITHMNGNICRCGTYHRIIAAIERAAKEG